MNNTLLRGLQVLELLSRSERPLTLTQIATQLGIVKSNVHRLMQGLTEMRYVLRHEDSGAYAASIKLWELGSAVLSNLDLRRHAERQMEALLEQTGESVHLSVLDGNEVVYVHKVESLNPVRAYTQIGGRVPAHCVATGKAQLAYRSADALADIAHSLVAHTRHTIVEPARFLREMKKIRDTGYAVNRGEWRDTVWGVAAPILGSRGFVIGALGISGPVDRMRKTNIAACAETVIASATAVSHALGGTPEIDALVHLGRAAR